MRPAMVVPAPVFAPPTVPPVTTPVLMPPAPRQPPMMDEDEPQGYKRAPRKRGMSVNRTFLSKGRANAPDNDKTLRIMIKM